MTTDAFDPKDKKYQVSEAFPPDKEETWPFPKEKDGWMLAHDSLRGEVTDMKEALAEVAKRGPMPGWGVTAIQGWCEAHFRHMHAHHTNEDDLFAPFCRERFHWPEKTEADHQDIIKKFDEIEGVIKALKEGDTVDDLVRVWDEYKSILFPHFREEEDVSLPLMRAYFTREDVAPKVQEIVSKGPKEEMGAIIYYTGEDTIRNEFMVQEGIPSFVWYIDFKGKLSFYKSTQIARLDALKSGVEPVPSSCSCNIL